MTQPSAKTIRKKESAAKLHALQEQAKSLKASDDMNKLVVMALIRCPAIYKQLPLMDKDKVPNPHVEICKTEDGCVIMTENAQMYRVIIARNNFYDKIVRKVKKLIAKWIPKKTATESEPSSSN